MDALRQQGEEAAQHRVVVLLLVVDAEGDLGQAGDGNVAQSLHPGTGYVRVQRVAEPGLRKGEGALDASGHIALLRRKSGQDTVLYSEDRVVDLPGRAGDKIPGQIPFPERLVLRQRVGRMTDAGKRNRAELPEEEDGFLLVLPDAEGGVDVRQYDTEVLRNQVSVVLQKNTLFSGSILDNLRWGNPEATEEECIEACKAACADEFIDRMPRGYQTKIERGGSNVSGGQKQRLCIARALLKKPKVLILDDSTSAVDTATDASIRDAFAKKIPGTTKIIIAQRISSVQSADRILVLDEGRVDAFDTHENLLKNNAIYQEIYSSQMEGGGDFDQPA